MDDELSTLLASVTARYAKHGQSHVLAYLPTLPNNDDEKLRFLRQLDDIEVETLSDKLTGALEEQRQQQQAAAAASDPPVGDSSSDAPSSSTSSSSIKPFSGKVGRTSDPALVSQCHQIGLDAVRSNTVAALLLAGGQGTRLGFDGPKGMYDIGLTSGRSLFRLVAERIVKLRELAAASAGSASDSNGEGAAASAAGNNVSVPLYVMTSPMNDTPTRAYFAENDYFGLPASDVIFFAQGVLPCLSPTGKILLETQSSCCMAPDGNGGIYPALLKSGALDDMAERGIQHIHAFAIDNALVRPADPTFVGYCISEKADCGNKVLWKTGPHEKVGVVAERDGRPCVVEYSDLSKEMAEATDDDTTAASGGGGGKLLFGAGNICNHYYTLEFLRNVVVPNLSNMYHVANKKIPVWNDEVGKTVAPTTTNNGIKLESFIFDVFPLSESMAVLDVNRDEEFAPVKNAPGSEADCPETACKMISNLGRGWLVKAGAELVGAVESDLCEVGPRTSYGGEGLENYRGKKVECPFSL